MPRDRGTIWFVIDDLVRHPRRELLAKWNYKSAITSSLFRGVLFFSTNVSAGLAAAVGALSAEFIFRFITAGFYGAVTQAFRRVEPPHVGTLGAMLVLPLIAHTLEILVHWSRGTPNLLLSIAVSMGVTAVSTSFSLFAMRQGALVVGEEDSQSLVSDLKRMPRLMWTFVARLVTSARLWRAWSVGAGA